MTDDTETVETTDTPPLTGSGFWSPTSPRFPTICVDLDEHAGDRKGLVAAVAEALTERGIAKRLRAEFEDQARAAVTFDDLLAVTMEWVCDEVPVAA